MRIFYAGPVSFFSASTISRSNFGPATIDIRCSAPIGVIASKKFTNHYIRLVLRRGRMAHPNKNIQLTVTSNIPAAKKEEINITQLSRPI
jgi:hypothetical protein